MQIGNIVTSNCGSGKGKRTFKREAQTDNGTIRTRVTFSDGTLKARLRHKLFGSEYPAGGKLFRRVLCRGFFLNLNINDMEFEIGGPLFNRLQWLNHKKPGYVVNGEILRVFEAATDNTEALKKNPEAKLKGAAVMLADFKKLEPIIAKNQKEGFDKYMRDPYHGNTVMFFPVWGLDGLAWRQGPTV